VGGGWEVYCGAQSVYGGKAVCGKELSPRGGEEELARMGRVGERGSRREGEACAAAEGVADGEEKLV
jgi:hypothetical protein